LIKTKDETNPANIAEIKIDEVVFPEFAKPSVERD
jgi:hypothetical protein